VNDGEFPGGVGPEDASASIYGRRKLA
jgi:hypothetical protein